ncbi:type I-E CRISPR-associated protein Cas6/Cse3/CasE [Aureimonas altamirensis]|uniref:type I-E CRISPR-associated protein Cas6/Cse3/CasE n=1 Tax=Aureimonas altamirensis TaxID=370622 RepID=UPI002036A9A3|nr:type I-E CRISPR-associated protein Cas6/Cse3/CasE [Aureimonas altamirensis]MCM2502576.1 type I-E CRISPR-associated protein Cas6/Cse3/CasE [Aureimonas altamirensis]
MSLYLSRVTLARTPATTALKALIDPVAGPARERLYDRQRGRIMDAHHRLIWALFADDPDRRRDYLWRAEGEGRFLVLSHRPPATDGAGLFLKPETKLFAPMLRAGDALHFALRANATRTRKLVANASGTRVDVVMDALHALPSGRESDDRRQARMEAAQTAGLEWLARQGERAGFVVTRFTAADYSVVPLPAHRGSREGQPQFGVIEMSGQLTVKDGEALIAQIGQGFGRAKAFGCGLMLIRRG